MSDTPLDSVAQTDFSKAIRQIADANNIIKERDTIIQDLKAKEDELKNEIQALEVNKKNLTEENSRIFQENNSGTARKKEQHEEAVKNIKEEMEKLEQTREEIKAELAELEEEKQKVSEWRAEAERIRIANEQESAELESKILESKRLSWSREDELEAIKAERAALETERRKQEIARDEVEKLSLENQETLKRITEAQENANKLFNDIAAERQENERIKAITQNEIGSADFIKNEAFRMVQIFRQALHTFVQLNGTQVRVPEITVDDLRFLVNDLIRQCEGKNIREILDAEFIQELENTAPVVFTDTPVVTEPTVQEETEEMRIAREAKEALNALGAEEEKTTENTAPVVEKPNYDTLTKPQFAEEAKSKYNIDLDIEMTKNEMIADFETKLAALTVPPVTE